MLGQLPPFLLGNLQENLRPHLVLHTLGGAVVLDPLRGDPMPWPLNQVITGYEIVIGEPDLPPETLLSVRASRAAAWGLLAVGALVAWKTPVVGLAVAGVGAYWMMNTATLSGGEE